jgi:hypothetical protein
MDTGNSQTQTINDRLNDLIKKAEIINKDIQTDGDKTLNEANNILADIDKSLNKISQIYSDVVLAEKKANNKIDRLILEEIKLLTADQ